MSKQKKQKKPFQLGLHKKLHLITPLLRLVIF
jgi:hypothetical protein